MADFDLHVKIDGLEDLERKFRSLGTDFGQRKYFDLVGMRLLAWSDELFKKQGRARGRLLRWRKLKPSTIKRRRKGSKKILQDTGRLRQSFVYKVHRSSEWVELGTQDERAAAHHFGMKPHLPARPLIPTVTNGREMATEILEAYVNKQLKKMRLE